MKNKTIVINLIGGPGSGKSTLAAGLFYELKKLGFNAEMSLEFAKDKVWEESIRTLDDQIYIFGKQYHKLWRLNNKVDIIITDSPLLVSLYYNQIESKYFNNFVIEQFNRFNNVTYFIERDEENYQEEGRLQTFDEAKEIDKKLIDILKKYNISFTTLNQNTALDNILVDILKN